MTFLTIPKKKFVTKFVTRITKFVTCVRKFVTYITKFVIKIICADSKKYQGDSNKLQGERENFLRINETAWADCEHYIGRAYTKTRRNE